jgi:ATP-dependent Clp protease ATP-binding subunit ClpA
MAEQLDEHFDVTLKRVVVRAIDEAARRGAANVEAEHLLLAIAATDDPAGRTLAEFGLDHAGVEAALRREREQSLRAGGVEPVDAARLQATPGTRPGWGTSLREALRRARYHARGHRDRRRLAVADTLIGVLRADLGTVPRALTAAGVDRDALVSRLDRL